MNRLFESSENWELCKPNANVPILFLIRRYNVSNMNIKHLFTRIFLCNGSWILIFVSSTIWLLKSSLFFSHFVCNFLTFCPLQLRISKCLSVELHAKHRANFCVPSSLWESLGTLTSLDSIFCLLVLKYLTTFLMVSCHLEAVCFCLSAMAQKLVNALKGKAMYRKSGLTPQAFSLSRVWPFMSWLLQQLLYAYRNIHFCISYHFPGSFCGENSYATSYIITAGSRNHLQKYFYFQQLFLVLWIFQFYDSLLYIWVDKIILILLAV